MELNIRGLLTSAAAVATVAATALAVPAAASASSQGPGATAGTTSVSSQVANIPTANLHAEFTRLQGHVTTGPRSGIVPPLGKHGAVTAGKSTAGKSTGAGAAAAGGSCTEPNCNLAYNGGAVQHSPHVYIVFWGPTWQTNTGEEATARYLVNFYKGLGGAGDTWSPVTSQYADGTGHPTFSGPVFVNDLNDSAAPPYPVTESDLAAEAAAYATTFGITDVADAQVIVASQSGTCFNDGFAGSCTPTTSGYYCAWHDSTSLSSGQNLSYTNLPYQLDAYDNGAACGENFINSGSAGTLDGFSIIGGHEYAESITDPVPPTGYIDNSDNSGGEIADKCAWEGGNWYQSPADPAGDITLSTGRFAVQSLWSNATSSCVMSANGPAGHVTGTWSKCVDDWYGRTTPANKIDLYTCTGGNPQVITYTAGHQLQVQGGCVTGQLIDVYYYPCNGATNKIWTRAGNQYINKATGKCLTDPGNSATNGTQLQVQTCANAVDQEWTLPSPLATGPAVGSRSKCVDDYYGRTTTANKIDIYTCTGGNPQVITYTAGGLLEVQGGCISGQLVDVYYYPCNGAAKQFWMRYGSEFVNYLTGKCLTVPNNNTTNGTQLVVATCANTVNQRWTLP